MARSFVFADESGDFTFCKGDNISRYFIVCTIRMTGCGVGTALMDLRRELAWKKAPLGDYFHATARSRLAALKKQAPTAQGVRIISLLGLAPTRRVRLRERLGPCKKKHSNKGRA